MKLISDERLKPGDLARERKRQIQSDEVLDQRLKVTAMLNFYEELAICVKDRSVNEQKLYDFFSRVLLDAHTRLEEYIRSERRVDNDQGYFCELEWLAKRWKERK
jgi:hypothetical protein